MYKKTRHVAGSFVLFLGSGLLLARDRALGTFARARVGLGSLSANRQSAAMTQSAIAADIHQTLDVALNLASQIAFDANLERVERVAQLLFVVLGEVFHACVGIDPRVGEHLRGVGWANTVNVLQRN